MENNNIALIKQELENLKDEFKELKSTTTRQEIVIQDLKSDSKVTEFQYNQIMETLNKLTNTTIPNLTAQIEELKNKPVKRYDQAISSLIGAIFGAIGGVVAGLFIKK